MSDIVLLVENATGAGEIILGCVLAVAAGLFVFDHAGRIQRVKDTTAPSRERMAA